MTADHIDYDALEASIASFDQAHPTQGACQHERYWRQTLPALLAENERLREVADAAAAYAALWFVPLSAYALSAANRDNADRASRALKAALTAWRALRSEEVHGDG